jgi:archaellum component FlaF (FlaF/FlaG flagellin family)
MGQELEIYQAIVAINVALTAVTITAYSIAISILGTERVRLQAQIDEILRNATDRIQRGEITNFEQAEREVIKTKTETRKIWTLLTNLSLSNVVLFPGLFFAISTSAAIVGMWALPDATIPGATTPYGFFYLSGLFMSGGIGLLVNALRAIEKAAGQPRPAKLTSEIVSAQIVLEAYKWDSKDTISLTLRNVGQQAIDLGNSELFLNGLLVGRPTLGHAMTLNPGSVDSCTFTAPQGEWMSGIAYPLRLLTPSGAVFSYSLTGKSTT